jgi:hypothetical protein
MQTHVNVQKFDLSTTQILSHYSLTCFVDVMVTEGDVTQNHRAAWVFGVRELNTAVC